MPERNEETSKPKAGNKANKNAEEETQQNPPVTVTGAGTSDKNPPVVDTTVDQSTVITQEQLAAQQDLIDQQRAKNAQLRAEMEEFDALMEAAEQRRQKAASFQSASAKGKKAKDDDDDYDDEAFVKAASLTEQKVRKVKVKFVKDHDFNVAGEQYRMKRGEIAMVELHQANQFASRDIAYVIN